MNYKLTKKEAKELIVNKLSHFYGVSPEEATYEHYYKAIALILRDMMMQGRKEFHNEAKKSDSKKIYYLCMEFLMGRSLKNNLYNLNLTKTMESSLTNFTTANRMPASETAVSADLPHATLTVLQVRAITQKAIQFFTNTAFSSRSLLTVGRPSCRISGCRAEIFGLFPVRRRQ